MARANSAVGMFEYSISHGGDRTLPWWTGRQPRRGVQVPNSKVVAKTHDNDNDLYDKYTRVSTGLIFD